MKKLSALTALVCLSSPLLSTNSFGHCNGGFERQTLLSKSSTFIGDCELQRRLELARTRRSYPLMGGVELEVDYWQGAYTRLKKTERLYQIDVYNCAGDLQSSFQMRNVTKTRESFFVDNPNLHDDVKSSFEANAPMTDAEANAALSKALYQCKSADPSDEPFDQ